MKLFRLAIFNPDGALAYGLVIRAESESRVREMAQEFALRKAKRPQINWIDTERVICEEIRDNGEEIILAKVEVQ